MRPRATATWTRAAIAAMALSVVVSPAASGAADAGRLDKSFSRDGIRRETFAPRFEEASDVLVQRGGAIHTAGWVDGLVQGLYVARYRPDGTLKRSFGTKGKAILELADYTYTHGLARQPDGKLVVVATKGLSSDETVIARYRPDGDLDPQFSGDGYDVRDLVSASSDHVRDVLILPDGDIMLVGWTTGTTIWLARYNPNGAPDMDFGTNGVLLWDPPGSELVQAAIRQGSKILLAGRYNGVAAVMRIDRNGALDPGFGVAGIREVTGGGSSAVGIARYPNGRLVVLTETSVAQMSADGTLASNFGSGGLFPTAPFIASPTAVATQPRGRVVIVGTGPGPDPGEERWRILRLTRRGALDRSFSGDGGQSTDLFGDLARPYDVASQADGKPLSVGMSGESGLGSDYHSTLIRYRGDVWTRALRVLRRRETLRVSGLQFPARPGATMVVSLYRLRGGRFVAVDRDRARLRGFRDPDRDGFMESRFVARLDRPGGGRCKVVAKSPASAGYAASRATKKFRC